MELSLGRASWYAGRLLCLKTLLAVSTAQVFAQDAAKPAPPEMTRTTTQRLARVVSVKFSKLSEIGRAHV